MACRRGVLLLCCVGGAALRASSAADDYAAWVNTTTPGVADSTANPILSPSERGEWILGDPTVVQIGDTLHMWANEVFHGILHYTNNESAIDPTRFREAVGSAAAVRLPGAMRPYAYFDADANVVALFYEQCDGPPPLADVMVTLRPIRPPPDLITSRVTRRRRCDARRYEARCLFQCSHMVVCFADADALATDGFGAPREASKPSGSARATVTRRGECCKPFVLLHASLRRHVVFDLCRLLFDSV